MGDLAERVKAAVSRHAGALLDRASARWGAEPDYDLEATRANLEATTSALDALLSDVAALEAEADAQAAALAEARAELAAERERSGALVRAAPTKPRGDWYETAPLAFPGRLYLRAPECEVAWVDPKIGWAAWRADADGDPTIADGPETSTAGKLACEAALDAAGVGFLLAEGPKGGGE